MIHEILAYKVFRSAGIAAPRTGYAYLRVNGAGLRPLPEHRDPRRRDAAALVRLDAASLRRGIRRARRGDVVPGKAGRFSVDEGSETDMGDLEALIAAVNGDRGLVRASGSRRRPQQMTRMWAVEKYIGHWDSYSGQRHLPRAQQLLPPQRFCRHIHDAALGHGSDLG